MRIIDAADKSTSSGLKLEVSANTDSRSCRPVTEEERKAYIGHIDL